MIKTYKEWEIDQTWLGDYVATHPDYDPTPMFVDDGPSDNRYVIAKTIEELKQEIDTWIEENK